MLKKYIINILLVFLLSFGAVQISFAAPEDTATQDVTEFVDDGTPAPHAKAAILVDMKSDKVLFAKNENERMYPASTTKILTSIIALENLALDEIVVAQPEAITPITNNHSHMGIIIGEELTVEQLLYGTLVYSANDAANVLAVRIAGSIEAFAQMMNTKATELGAVNSHFVNPHGYHNDNHYTTASDLTKITKYAMQNEKFREIVKTDMYTMGATNKYKEIRYLSNTNHLVSRRRYYQYFYDKAIGIKTGFTDEAGSCLVSAAVDGDTELLSVVMNCQNTTMVSNGAYSFVDSKNLLQYGFDNFKYITVAANGDILSDSAVYEARDNVRVVLTVDNPISGLLPSDININDVVKTPVLNEKIAAPISKGDVLGTIECSYQGEVIGTANLIATNDVKKDYIIAIIHLFIKIITNPIFIILLLIFVWLIVSSNIRRAKKRKQRRSQLNHFNPDVYQPREREYQRHRRH